MLLLIQLSTSQPTVLAVGRRVLETSMSLFQGSAEQSCSSVLNTADTRLSGDAVRRGHVVQREREVKPEGSSRNVRRTLTVIANYT
jgi:hypothetical protein